MGAYLVDQISFLQKKTFFLQKTILITPAVRKKRPNIVAQRYRNNYIGRGERKNRKQRQKVVNNPPKYSPGVLVMVEV
jgi:hypothetical protein